MTGREQSPDQSNENDLDGSSVVAPGHHIVSVDAAGTVLFVVVTIVASLLDGDVTTMANLLVSVVLFVGGCVAFGVGFVRAAGRSRTEVIDLAGLFYLTGSAPRNVRRQMLGLWYVQIAVAAVGVAITAPPFGVMAPVWGIGLLTLWSSRHATFPPRPAARR